jgi:hypothetical protein
MQRPNVQTPRRSVVLLPVARVLHDIECTHEFFFIFFHATADVGEGGPQVPTLSQVEQNRDHAKKPVGLVGNVA